jgi:hypothetical protein
MHIFEIPPQVTVGYVGGVAAFALRRGGPRERLVGAFLITLLANWGAWVFLKQLVPGPIVHFVGLVVCLACARKGRSYWTIWASAGFLLMVATDVVSFTTPSLDEWTRQSANLIWLFAATSALLWGACRRIAPSPAAPRAVPALGPTASA